MGTAARAQGATADERAALENRRRLFRGRHNGGNIYTKEKFGDCRIHVEWATPATFRPNAVGQNRGNSGVFLPGQQELQILDSYENETYADGQAAAVYGKYPPTTQCQPQAGRVAELRHDARAAAVRRQRKMIKPCHADGAAQWDARPRSRATQWRRNVRHPRHPRSLHAGAFSEYLGAAVRSGAEEVRDAIIAPSREF